MSKPEVHKYFRTFFIDNINGLDNVPYSPSLPLTSATTTPHIRRMLFTEQESARYNIRSSYANEYQKRFANKPEELRLTVLGLVKKIYKTQPKQDADKFIFEDVLIPLKQASR